LGKPLLSAEYPTFADQGPEILLTLRVEPMTFISARTPRSFIAKTVNYRLGHTYTFAEGKQIWHQYMVLRSEEDEV